jgi:hypothetical protein
MQGYKLSKEAQHDLKAIKDYFAWRGMLPRHSRLPMVTFLNHAETLRTGQHAPSGGGVH